MGFRAGGRGGGWVGGGGGAGVRENAGGNKGPGRGGFGNDSWQAQGNRFSALQQHQRQGGGGGGGQQPPQEAPEEAVRNDLQVEKPTWLLSCYGHARGGANDLTGDVSFEEARWSTLRDIHAHRTPLTINAEFKGAVRAKQEELNQLLARTRERGGRVPSLGGPPIRVRNTWLAQFLEQQLADVQAQPGGFGGAPQPQPPSFGFGSQQHTAPASGSFGSAIGSFGQPAGFGNTAAPAPFGQTSGFGEPPRPASGALREQPVAAAAPFGQPSGTGFGGGSGTGFGAASAGGGAKASWAGQGGFGAAKSTAGQAPAVLFGQNLTASASTGTGGAFVPMLPAGQAQVPSLPPAFPSPGFPPAAPLQGFGSPTPVDPGSASASASLRHAPIFHAPVAATASPLTGLAAAGDSGSVASAAAVGSSGHEEVQAFQVATFTLGKIPEMAPPPELCF
ncbi:hypothetical protein Vafri_4526 [Volvox africanus]|uniref:Uncharacterized protein n=1 Tax=Volvox africanus TaxID=51714 RepID=A0A8J4AUD6_9CHLO|nr:hypothetical protein Vafri_4526 [Volvox africanus]